MWLTNRASVVSCRSPDPVREPVNQDRVKTGISNGDLPRRTRRRVALEDGLDIFFKRLPHAE